MSNLTFHHTNKQWAMLGRDLKLLQDAWEDRKYGGTGVHCAELVERFEEVKYIFLLPKHDVIACADFYNLNSRLFARLNWLDWHALVKYWRDEDAEE